MNLHDLGIAVQALIWMMPTGGNGHPLGPAAQRALHLYPIERNTPPALGTDYRHYWRPFSGRPTTDPERPLCGAIKTTARHTYFRDWANWGTRNCPRCAEIAQRTHTQTGTREELVQNDPWTRMAYHERRTMPDPVTGT